MFRFLTRPSSLIAALFALTLGSGPVAAQQVRDIHELGLHPFTGTHAEACELHVNAHGSFTMNECLRAIAMTDDAEQCPERAVLRDGTTWWMLFTDDDGTHRIGVYRIAFGAAVAADDPQRLANDCFGIDGGEDMVNPLACGNYSVPYVAPPAPAPVPRQTTRAVPVPTPRPAPVITAIPSTSALQPSGGSVAIFNVGGVYAYCRP